MCNASDALFRHCWIVGWKKEKIENYETSSLRTGYRCFCLLGSGRHSTSTPGHRSQVAMQSSWASYCLLTHGTVTFWRYFVSQEGFVSLSFESLIIAGRAFARHVSKFSMESHPFFRQIIIIWITQVVKTIPNTFNINSMANTVKTIYFLLVLSGLAGPALASSHHKNKGGKKETYGYDVVFEEVADNDFIENNLQDLGDRIIWGQESLFDKIGDKQIGLTTVIHNHFFM